MVMVELCLSVDGWEERRISMIDNWIEASQLSEHDIQHRSFQVAEFWAITPADKFRLRRVTGMCWNPFVDISQAMHLASLMSMNIVFGDKVVLVSEPAGAQSRTVAYELSGRVSAMQSAITLLAADCYENI